MHYRIKIFAKKYTVAMGNHLKFLECKESQLKILQTTFENGPPTKRPTKVPIQHNFFHQFVGKIVKVTALPRAELHLKL